MNLRIDSRKVEKGDAFFCMIGATSDGHNFVKQAIQNGASIIVHMNELDGEALGDTNGVLFVKVADTVSALNHAADLFYSQPSKKLKMYGVTGTNGKSTIAYLISKIYSKHVGPCGYMGTIGGSMEEKDYNVSLTTPDSIQMQENLKNMLDDGAKAASIEVSAHGLVQGRVDAIDFDCAIYTNVTREHLDYFSDMDNYFKAKALFFTLLKPDAVAIINADDEYAPRIYDNCTGRLVTYGIDRDADYRAVDVEYTPSGMNFSILHQGKKYPVITDMHVTYNLYNLLAIAAAFNETGLPLEKVIPEFRNVETVPGRMMLIDRGQPFKVMLDYAHTDDSYQQLFSYLRNDMPGVKRIITVSGAPGMRDSSNRLIFGKWFSTFCDHSILCEEDYRNEPPEKIANDIAAGFIRDDYSWEYIEDRAEAIAKGINMAEQGDVVVILGKGCENYLEGKDGKRFWMGDDQAAIKALEALYPGK